MFDHFDIYDDNDCSGNCEKCPYAIWNKTYDAPVEVIGCKVGEC